MASRSRRQISPFNLSFLDIMFCGFGAVVMLVLIINSNSITRRNEKHENLHIDAERLALELSILRQDQAELGKEIAQKESEIKQVLKAQKDMEKNAVENKAQQNSLAERIQQLKADSKNLQRTIKKLAADNTTITKDIQESQEAGQRVRKFEGEGHRQYLTGFKLGGKRVLILIDSSASMLDRKVVDIIRRRVMDDASKRAAPKWRRSLRTVEWTVARLPPESRVQVVHFNEKADRLGDVEWIKATDSEKVNTMLGKLSTLVPRGGTSLENIFRYVESFSIKPDNIILITDGLPTLGRTTTRKATVSGEDRVKLFQRAVKRLPSNVPVNTILFPMEGDPMAAVLFWRLAAATSGSFFTPSQDWP